jgi:hypothetical protein
MIKQNAFIDVFYLPDVDPNTPYRCFIWEEGSIVNATRHADLETTAAWCKTQQVPIRVYDDKVRQDLRDAGIDALPPIAREKQVRELGE